MASRQIHESHNAASPTPYPTDETPLLQAVRGRPLFTNYGACHVIESQPAPPRSECAELTDETPLLQDALESSLTDSEACNDIES
jgi:hypothetical protein